MKKLFLPIILSLIVLYAHGQIDESAAIDSIFSDFNKPNNPGCALGIIKNGELIYSKGYGLANLEYEIPITVNSVFRTGSLSKQFTAACIVLLEQQGKLDLDNTLDQFFPDFPAYSKNISIRYLLNHTSGLVDYFTIAELKGIKEDESYLRDEDVMEWLISQHELNFNPGDEYSYTNSGYWLLGQIVNQVARMNLADFAEKELFVPLGMSSTHFHNDYKQIVKNRASGYAPNKDGTFHISMTRLDLIGDGSIFTSINDIKKWDDAFYNSSVLNNNFWEIMTEPGELNNGEKIDYAKGLFIETYKGLQTISHGGSFVGFRAFLIRFPEERLSIAILANRSGANHNRRGYRVADLLLGEKLLDDKKATGEMQTKTQEVSFIELSVLLV